MGKKRKAVAGRHYAPKEPQEKQYDENVDLYDSEDEFHMQRDEIRLADTPAEKRLKKWKEDDDLQMSDEEEILGYSLSEDENEDEEDDDEQHTEGSSDDDEAKDENEETGGWGSSTRNYYNADAIETEQDALDEEEEAKRIQRAKLQRMSAADFGLTEEDLVASEAEEEDELAKSLRVQTEVLPEIDISNDMSPEDKLKLLKGRYPEFDLLAKEFVDLHSLHSNLSVSASAAEAVVRHGYSQKSKILPPTPLVVTKFRALSAYLGALSMYFALLTSTAHKQEAKAALGPAVLREHPIMETLFSTRKLWQRVKDLEVPDVSELLPEHEHALEAIDEEDNAQEDEDSGPEVVASVDPDLEKKRRKAERKAAKRAAKTAALREAQNARAQVLQKTEESLQHLSKLRLNGVTNGATTNGTAKKPRYEEYDSGDSEMEDLDGLSSEAARKKKSLRFYTSQIAQKAHKRGSAGAELGGDADIPYRERLKDRQERLNALAEKRGQRDAQDGDVLGGDSDNEDDKRVARELRGEMEDAGEMSENDLYNRAAAASKSKKDEKRRRQEEATAPKYVHEDETVGEDGKRAIGYKIEKNKGLTPFRKKDVRNPRVKKRRKYDEKMKKLKSVKAVYSKEREGRGGYGGELTGIKTGLVKSIKLS